MSPDVVTCMMSTRPLGSGNPLAAVFRTYHDAPVSVLLSKLVAPLVKKNGLTGCVESSTREGSAAPSIPEIEAGPVRPIVA